MESCKKIIFALALFVFATFEIKAMDDGVDNFDYLFETKGEKFVRIVKEQKKAHPFIYKSSVCGLLTTLLVSGLYKYDSKFRQSVNKGLTKAKDTINNNVVEPVSKLSKKTKMAGLAITLLIVGYFGYNKLAKFKNVLNGSDTDSESDSSNEEE